MEKWRKRETSTIDYEESVLAAEREWMEKERESNTAALELMRSYIPTNLSDITNDAFQNCVSSNHGLFPIELIQELKRNKLLHWIVTHRDDIASTNFLVGDGKQYFENLELYDVVEMRAISMCLPEKFKIDGDGRKMEWRSRFMTRVKLLVSQQNRELVKGGWDKEKSERIMVLLFLF
jgi:hypothetical protein